MFYNDVNHDADDLMVSFEPGVCMVETWKMDDAWADKNDWKAFGKICSILHFNILLWKSCVDILDFHVGIGRKLFVTSKITQSCTRQKLILLYLLWQRENNNIQPSFEQPASHI